MLENVLLQAAMKPPVPLFYDYIFQYWMPVVIVVWALIALGAAINIGRRHGEGLGLWCFMIALAIIWIALKPNITGEMR